MPATAAPGFGRNRRRHERVRVPANCVDDPQLTALNLSESGMLLATSRPRRCGGQIALRVTLDMDQLALSARIVRCEAAHSIFETGVHLGICFTDVRIADTLVLREYVARRLANGDAWQGASSWPATQLAANSG